MPAWWYWIWLVILELKPGDPAKIALKKTMKFYITSWFSLIVATSAFSNSMRHNSCLHNWIPMAILLDMILTDLNSESLDGVKRTLIEFLSFLPGPERTTVKVLTFLPGPERTTVKVLTFLPGPKWTVILFPSWTQEKKKKVRLKHSPIAFITQQDTT